MGESETTCVYASSCFSLDHVVKESVVGSEGKSSKNAKSDRDTTNIARHSGEN